MDKKEVFIVRSTRPDTDSRLTKTVEMLSLLDYKVTVLAWDRNGESDLKDTLTINNTKIDLHLYRNKAPHGRGIKNLLGLIGFNRWIKRTLNQFAKNAFAIHSCDLDTGLSCKKICKKNHIKLVYDIYDFYSFSRKIPFPASIILEKLECKVVDYSACTIICSDERKEQIKKSKQSNVCVIYNSPKIDDSFVNGSLTKPGNIIKLCYVGVLSFSRLLKEIIDELPKHPNYELYIGGIGPLESFVKSHVGSNLHYYGAMKYSDVLHLESQCDLLFATYDPSIKGHQMSAPNKIYEAMALGKPIIVCNGTSIDKVVNNSFGLSCDYCAADFFAKCDSIFQNDLYDLFSQNAKALYPKYSFDRNLTIMKQIYEELI